MPAETAIVVPVDEAEPIVGHVRRLYDPVARRGVPAHITLLYPFVHPSEVPNEIDALTELFAGVPAFGFSLTEIGCFPATAYLHPDPAATFVHLTEMIAQRWPAYPPYGGKFSAAIPHLTVADQVDADVLDAVQRTLSPHLPIKCLATAAWLLCNDDHGFWSCRHVVPFGATSNR